MKKAPETKKRTPGKKRRTKEQGQKHANGEKRRTKSEEKTEIRLN